MESSAMLEWTSWQNSQTCCASDASGLPRPWLGILVTPVSEDTSHLL
jgi:hypothetical protein